MAGAWFHKTDAYQARGHGMCFCMADNPSPWNKGKSGKIIAYAKIEYLINN
jgi:hypothetical protein